jgi:hypothetical protein
MRQREESASAPPKRPTAVYPDLVAGDIGLHLAEHGGAAAGDRATAHEIDLDAAIVGVDRFGHRRFRHKPAVFGENPREPLHGVGFHLHRRLRKHLRLMVVERLPIVRCHVCDTDNFILLSAGSSGSGVSFVHGQKGRR